MAFALLQALGVKDVRLTSPAWDLYVFQGSHVEIGFFLNTAFGMG